MRIMAFSPMGNTVSVDATATTSTTAITQAPEKGGGNMMVSCRGTDPVYIKFGTSGTVVTVATGIPVLSGNTVIFSVGPGVTHVACICDTTETGTIHFTPGRGGV